MKADPSCNHCPLRLVPLSGESRILLHYAGYSPGAASCCFIPQSTSFSFTLVCPAHPVVYLVSIYHIFPYFMGTVFSCFGMALLHLWCLLQPPSFPTPCSSPVGKESSSLVLFQSVSFHDESRLALRHYTNCCY